MATIAIRKYEVTLTGTNPLLMHQDSIEWADKMEKWKNDPKNKKFSKAGDDRTPAFRWMGYLYHDDNIVALPQDMIMRCIMEGSGLVLVPGGKMGKTFKSQSQSGISCSTPYFPLFVGGAEIKMTDIHPLREEDDFSVHQETVESLGFALWPKRARIGSSKHIRVRPRFDEWSVVGTLQVFDRQISDDILLDILEQAGKYKGLGNWRPSSRTPGPYGTFTVSMKAVKE